MTREWTTPAVYEALVMIADWLEDTDQGDVLDRFRDVVATSTVTQADAVTFGDLIDASRVMMRALDSGELDPRRATLIRLEENVREVMAAEDLDDAMGILDAVQADLGQLRAALDGDGHNPMPRERDA